MTPFCRCRTVVLSGGDHDVVSLRSAFPNGPRHIPFADSAPNRRFRCAGHAGGGLVGSSCNIDRWPQELAMRVLIALPRRRVAGQEAQ
jgi:hypothetical protein